MYIFLFFSYLRFVKTLHLIRFVLLRGKKNSKDSSFFNASIFFASDLYFSNKMQSLEIKFKIKYKF